MTDPTFIPEADRELLVVYPDPDQAEAARRALLDRGVPEGEIHVDDEPDTVASLRAEMHEELTRAWVVPNAAALYPSGAARGLALASGIGAIVGLLAAFPLALIDVGGSYWLRWVVFAVVGVAFGLTIGLVAGPASGAPRPGELPAAARGTMLRVERDTEVVRRVLSDLDPVRIDEVTEEGDPIATVSTEHPDTMAETVRDAAASARGDDYHPQR